MIDLVKKVLYVMCVLALIQNGADAMKTSEGNGDSKKLTNEDLLKEALDPSPTQQQIAPVYFDGTSTPLQSKNPSHDAAIAAAIENLVQQSNMQEGIPLEKLDESKFPNRFDKLREKNAVHMQDQTQQNGAATFSWKLSESPNCSDRSLSCFNEISDDDSVQDLNAELIDGNQYNGTMSSTATVPLTRLEKSKIPNGLDKFRRQLNVSSDYSSKVPEGDSPEEKPEERTNHRWFADADKHLVEIAPIRLIEIYKYIFVDEDENGMPTEKLEQSEQKAPESWRVSLDKKITVEKLNRSLCLFIEGKPIREGKEIQLPAEQIPGTNITLKAPLHIPENVEAKDIGKLLMSAGF
ncbi:hypothetical protein FACS189449_10160 [Alphaproteobacteria bacterium]|nr:hypothetical protein FACS189449_10160 [Alphaproteobacteria bacterium]